MDLASLYIILGSISFVTSVVTLGVLIKKFIDQPAAHGFFVYSDTIASALLSLGLLLDGVRQPFLITFSQSHNLEGVRQPFLVIFNLNFVGSLFTINAKQRSAQIVIKNSNRGTGAPKSNIMFFFFIFNQQPSVCKAFFS